MKSKEKTKIWVVDDDPGILEVVQIILEDAGYDTTIISSGSELDRRIEGGSPDLIILDILISGSNGADIAKKLRSNPTTRPIPIIMVSANIHTMEIAHDAGADDFLLKPFNIDDLEAVVKKNLKKQSSHGKPRKPAGPEHRNSK